MDNPLCDKLQKEFRGRGINAPGSAASVSTREAMRRIARGESPFDDAPTIEYRVPGIHERKQSVPETARTVSGRTATKPKERRETHPTAYWHTPNDKCSVRPLEYKHTTNGRAKSRTFEAIHNYGFAMPERERVHGYTRAYTSAAKVRATAAQYNRERAAQLNAKREGIYGVPVLGGALEILSDAAAWIINKCRKWYNHASGRVAEERIISSKASVPVGAITLGLVFVVILFVIVYSCSEANEARRELRALEQQQEQLIEQERQLTVALEQKDDIRQIYQIATEKLGMVEPDEVESRFVSVNAITSPIELTPKSQNAKDTTIFSALQSWGKGVWDHFH